jgi:hypothetical protein
LLAVVAVVVLLVRGVEFQAEVVLEVIKALLILQLLLEQFTLLLLALVALQLLEELQTEVDRVVLLLF